MPHLQLIGFGGSASQLQPIGHNEQAMYEISLSLFKILEALGKDYFLPGHQTFRYPTLDGLLTRY
jgi:hypothetical protein